MKRLSTILAASALAASIFAVPVPSLAGVFVGVGITVGYAPPPIPVYVQPPALVQNAIWTPGYWAYGPGGYYWVPGAWVVAPQVGYLWTPGYWGYNGAAYVWNAGYWGPTVGFYGGVNYGCGYNGAGYVGGRWSGNQFQYNTAVTNVNRTIIRNVYEDRTVVINRDRTPENRTSYYAGPRGTTPRPAEQQPVYHNQPRTAPAEPRTEPIRTEPIRTEPVRTEPVRTEPYRTQHPAGAAAPAHQAHAGQTNAEQTHAEQAHAEQAHAEHKNEGERPPHR